MLQLIKIKIVLKKDQIGMIANGEQNLTIIMLKFSLLTS